MENYSNVIMSSALNRYKTFSGLKNSKGTRKKFPPDKNIVNEAKGFFEALRTVSKKKKALLKKGE